MFEQPPLSPDLEWMLRSQQVSVELIGDVAVREYSQQIYKLLLQLTGDPELALDGLRETLATAIIERHRFPGDWAVQTWLFMLAIRNCRKLQFAGRLKQKAGIAPRMKSPPTSLSPEEAQLWRAIDGAGKDLRFVLVLYFAHHLKENELMRVLGWEKPRLQRQLARAQVFVSKIPVTNERKEPDQHSWVSASINRRWEAIDLTETDLKRLITHVATRTRARERQQSRYDYLVNLVFVGGFLVVVAFIGWFSRNIDNQRTPREVVHQTVVVTKIVMVPRIRRVTQAPTALVTPQPLGESSNPGDVSARMQQSYQGWDNVRVDAQIHLYGPPGYVGPARKFRNLVWVSSLSPDNPVVDKVLLSGDLDSERPKFASRIQGSSIYMVELDSGLSYYFGSNGPVLVINESLPSKYLGRYSYNYQSIMNGSALNIFSGEVAYNPAGMRVLGKDRQSNRETIVVDAVLDSGQKHRLWIDTLTGIVLRRWVYDSQAPEIVSEEMVVTHIDFDVLFPYMDSSSPYRWLERNDWASFWQAPVDRVEAQTWTLPPGRQSPVLKAPPPGYDPAGRQIFFLWDSIFNIENELSSVANLYSEDYLLGAVSMGSPWNVVCERSPDGRTLAYIPGAESLNFPTSGLSWLTLLNPTEIHEVLTPGSPTGFDFEFSPDSHYLAFSGCGGGERNCGLYVQDLRTQKSRKLYADGILDSITWSLDGQNLAAVANEYSQGGVYLGQELVVIEVSSGLVVHEQPVDWADQNLIRKLPVGRWDADFPTFRRGLEGCTLPGSH